MLITKLFIDFIYLINILSTLIRAYYTHTRTTNDEACISLTGTDYNIIKVHK